jgi:hypothetical protein
VVTKALFNLQVPVIEGLKTNFKRRKRVLTRRRRLVGGSKFEKMRVAN